MNRLTSQDRLALAQARSDAQGVFMLTIIGMLSLMFVAAIAQGQDRIKVELNGKTIIDGTYTPASQPAKPAPVPPPVVDSDTSPLVLDKPIELADGQVYDGLGKTIDATKVDVAFRIFDRNNVTIRNVRVLADGDSHVIDVWQCKGVTITNVAAVNDANYVLRVRRSGNVTVDGLSAGNIRAYLVWVDSSDGVTLRNCKLTVGSRHETGIRTQYGATNLLIESCSITNKLNKKTALRIHDGRNITARKSVFEGQVWVGPMGGGDGGQDEPNAAKRIEQLAYVTDGVTIEGCTINGSFGPQAGLRNFVMRACVVNVPEDAPNFGYFYNNVVWAYPDKEKQRPGEPVRGQPQGQLVDVVITQKQKTLNWHNGQGPLQRVNVTLNGNPLK